MSMIFKVSAATAGSLIAVLSLLKYLPNQMEKAQTPTSVSNATTATSTTFAPSLQWGAYVGDSKNNLQNFENLVGKQINILAVFKGWDEDFPLDYVSPVGEQGKTLLIFWEPQFGFDTITSGEKDSYILKFAAMARQYEYPVILVPFPEMNLNEGAWGYGHNTNTAQSFKLAWMRLHNFFYDAPNVKFGLAYNSNSIPNVPGNQFDDYYPGSYYVDYVGVDGFNFGDPWLSFSEIFDAPIQKLQTYNKPIYIFSMGCVAGDEKAAWISEGLGFKAKAYHNVKGWIWFNQGGAPNWLVNSDTDSLAAFKSIIPQ